MEEEKLGAVQIKTYTECKTEEEVTQPKTSVTDDQIPPRNLEKNCLIAVDVIIKVMTLSKSSPPPFLHLYSLTLFQSP